MATHLACHDSDMLPNTFPPMRPSIREHGAVSLYEQNHGMHMAASWMNEVADDCGFPIMGNPVPTLTPSKQIQTLPDPDLCLTPEKPRHTRSVRGAGALRPGVQVTIEREEGHRGVRFDNIVDVRHLSPMSPESDLDCSIIETGTEVSDVDSPIHQLTDLTNTEQGVSQDDPKTYQYVATRYGNTEDTDSDFNPSGQPSPTLCGAITESSGEVQNILRNKNQDTNLSDIMSSIQPRQPLNSNKHRQKVKSKLQDTNSAGAKSVIAEQEHELTRPEFNTTAWLSRDLQQLKSQQLDVLSAVKEKLTSSPATKNKLSEKVYSKVGAGGPQFPGLLSVDTTEDDVLQSAESKMEARVMSGIRPKKPQQKTNIKPPDIMDFFTPDLQRESASFIVEGLPTPQHQLQTANLERAFDVYRHNRVWENWDR